jgi:O-antigen biosynthesis protein
MADPTVSLIVVSRQRAVSLMRTLKAVQLQDYSALELIVVADPAAADAVRALGLPFKLVTFDRANISAARNAGLLMASGDLVAFLDDDAVPEPTWISRLAAAFANSAVRVATGFVRGRNGISDQWRAADVDRFGHDRPLSVDRLAVTLLAGTPTRAVKAQGTNCAFRRADLVALGGFDEGFRFYLEDADISLRLAGLGGLAAIVPDAVVQHGFAASIRRRADRVPLDLRDIAASAAYFLRRHAPDADMALQHMVQRQSQRARLIAHMVTGGLEPRDIARLMAGFDQGWAAGMARNMASLSPMQATGAAFVPLGTKPRAGTLLAGRIWQRRAVMRRASVEAAMGKIVTVICLSPTTWYHHDRFESAGFWMQEGGRFGRSVRDQAMLRFIGFSSRVREEAARIAQTRPIS